jgi:phosphosulfolactate phosphohydrolase-like enzyme
MVRSFAIDSLPESAPRYRETHALAVVDVFRATTCILTALFRGHAVYPVGTMAEAVMLAGRLRDAQLAGEQDGIKPPCFDHDNSPAALSRLEGASPIVLLTSAGTLLLTNCRGASVIYVASLRNLSATAARLCSHNRVALIGAGTRGKPRPEDQLVCAWIGDKLFAAGYEPENESTMCEVETWRGADLEVIRQSPSADYLRNTGREEDIEFVLENVDDIPEVAVYNGQQVSLLSSAGFGDVAAALES